MKKSKRFLFNVVEEFILNPDYKDYSGGRIEVFDKKNDSGFAIGEARFLIPTEFMEKFREVFDFKESDLPVYIDFDVKKMIKDGQKRSNSKNT